MNKALVACVIILCCGRTLQGQVKAGFQGSFNLCTFSGKNYIISGVSNLYLPGFQTGIFLDIPAGKQVSVRPALLVEIKGSRGTIHLSSLHADVGTSLWYIDLPVVCRVNLIHRKINWYMEAGGYAGLGLYGKATYESPDTSVSRTIHWGSNADDEFRRPDFGITAGTGISWKQFYVGFSGTMGLANIFAFPETGNTVHHRVIGLVAGIHLNMSKRKNPSGN